MDKAVRVVDRGDERRRHVLDEDQVPLRATVVPHGQRHSGECPAHHRRDHALTRRARDGRGTEHGRQTEGDPPKDTLVGRLDQNPFRGELLPVVQGGGVVRFGAVDPDSPDEADVRGRPRKHHDRSSAVAAPGAQCVGQLPDDAHVDPFGGGLVVALGHPPPAVRREQHQRDHHVRAGHGVGHLTRFGQVDPTHLDVGPGAGR